MNTMIPSAMETITPGQIGKIQEDLGAALRKSGLPREAVQRVIENQIVALNSELVTAIRKRVKAVSDFVVRHYKVDRTKSRREMIMALGRKENVNSEILATMPTEGPEEGDLYFFRLKYFVPVAEVAAEFEFHDLVPDPCAQMQVNADDPAFADEHPNGVQWGLDSYVAFDSYVTRGEHYVSVRRSADGWHGRWWFAGRRKQS